MFKNAFDKYRLEGKDVQTAYDLAQKDYDVAQKQGVTIPKPEKPSNDGFEEYVRREQKFLNQLHKQQSASDQQNISWRNGWRTPDGKFASPQGQQISGAWAEQDVWDAIKQKDGWDVIEGRVYTTDKTGQIRVYDGVAVTPQGKFIGLEVKSGTSVKTVAQRTFDNRIGVRNPAIGIGKSVGINVTHTITIRR